MLSLLALATGVIADPLGLSFGSVKVMVRHQGPPQEFTLHIRTKETRSAQWEYLDPQRLHHFPRKLMTSATGRMVRLRLPLGLKTYSQVCSRLGPPDEAYSSSFRVLLSIQSCANLPTRSSETALAGLVYSSHPGDPGLSLLPLQGSPADTSKGPDPA
jgi:hypothetical protein